MHGARPGRILAAGALAALLAGHAQAGKVYRWTDRDGVTHYTDRRPEDGAVAASALHEIHVRAEPGAIARLRVEREDGRYLAWADNRLAGPIEVRLDFRRSTNIASDPALPARATVPTRGTALVAVLQADDPTADGEFELTMRSLPGAPGVTPGDVAYTPPLRLERLRVDQGYDGAFSHTDAQNRYALDFAAPVGTTVLAARDGVVMQVESDFDRAGLNLEKYGGRANFVRILHADGSMALYAHLQPDGVHVRLGQRVRAGQPIGLSGNTGFTTGPHLHFAVQVNRGMRLESVPFRMDGVAAD